MKYLVIGSGGTGGCIAAFMAKAGKDVTAIARGEHLAAIQKNGLTIETTFGEDFTIHPIKAVDMDHYHEQPDVILICVKGYSLADVVPFIKRIAHPETVVIPILNIYGTGEKLQAMLPDLLVTDGCIYISAEIKSPGIILQSGEIFRVVYGVRNPADERPVLGQIATDFADSGIRGILSDNIRRDALQKFAYVSPMAACGAYYDVEAGAVQHDGPVRDLFIDLTREILALAAAMGIEFTVDIVATNLKILANLSPTATTSMQRDLRRGAQSEIDGLLFEVVRLGRQYVVAVPNYERLARHFGFEI